MRRWTFTILLFLLLVSGGAVVNIAVAWGSVAAAEIPGLAPQGPAPPLIWPRAVPSHWPPPEAVYRFIRHRGYHIHRWLGSIRVLEGGERVVLGPDHESNLSFIASSFREIRQSEEYRIDIFRAGWPFAAVQSERWREVVFRKTASGWEGPTYRYEGHPARTAWTIGIVPPRNLLAFTDDWKFLPIRPIWPGFAVNTLLYAALLWLLMPGPFVLRRHIRVKCGRCPKCGYDLRGKHDVGCPECGWNRQPETAP